MKSLPAGSLDDGLAVVKVAMQRSLPERRESIDRPGAAIFKRLRTGEVFRLFELAGMRTQVAVADVEQLLELVEREFRPQRQSTHDSEAHALVHQPLSLGVNISTRRSRHGRQLRTSPRRPCNRRARPNLSAHRQVRPIRKPKSRCRPPNPRPSMSVWRPSGSSSAHSPSATNNPPITAMVRVVGTLAATSAHPYSSNHVPGMACRLPAVQCTAVMTAPANIGGIRHRASLRMGAPDTFSPRSDDGRATNAVPRLAARAAASNQMPSQCSRRPGGDDSTAASRPTRPMALPADPGTAIDDAASMDERM